MSKHCLSAEVCRSGGRTPRRPEECCAIREEKSHTPTQRPGGAPIGATRVWVFDDGAYVLTGLCFDTSSVVACNYIAKHPAVKCPHLRTSEPNSRSKTRDIRWVCTSPVTYTSLRGNHLLNTTCPTHVFFKSGQ